MNARLSQIVRRREALQRRCAAQRVQLEEAVEALEARLRGLDHVTLALRKLRLAPVLLAVIATVVASTPLVRNVSRGLMVAGALRQLFRSRSPASAADSERAPSLSR